MLTPESIKAMSVSKARHTLELSYKALGLLNKLSRREVVVNLKKRLFGNINRLRAVIRNSEKLKPVSRNSIETLVKDFGGSYMCNNLVLEGIDGFCEINTRTGDYKMFGVDRDTRLIINQLLRA